MNFGKLGRSRARTEPGNITQARYAIAKLRADDGRLYKCRTRHEKHATESLTRSAEAERDQRSGRPHSVAHVSACKGAIESFLASPSQDISE